MHGHLCFLCVSFDRLGKKRIALRNHRNSTFAAKKKASSQWWFLPVTSYFGQTWVHWRIICVKHLVTLHSQVVVFAGYQLFRTNLGALEDYMCKTSGYFTQSSEAKEPA